MQTFKLYTALAFAGVVFINGCKKEENNFNETIPLQTTLQETVALGSASGFAIFANEEITNKGVTNIVGNLGINLGDTAIGFPPGILEGTQHFNNSLAHQANIDLSDAYNNAVARTASDMVMLSGNIGGLTLTPGLYKSTSSLTTLSGNLTFDAKGNTEAIFIIQVASALNIVAESKIILNGGAMASNIFWLVGTSAIFGTATEFKGNVIAIQSITFNTGATLYGRALAKNGSVLMNENIIVAQH